MSMIDNTVKTAHQMMDETKDSAGHTAVRVRSTVLDGLQTVVSAITLIRSLGVDDALGWVGLQRSRTNPLVPILTFGAGFLTGAAAGILLAPMSGAQARRMIVEGSLGLEREAERTAARAKAQVAEKTGELVDKAKHAVDKVESTVAQSATSHP